MKPTYKSPTTKEEENRKSRNISFIGLMVIIDIFLIDQISKWFVYERIMLPFYRKLPVPKFDFGDIVNWFMGPVEKLPPLTLTVNPFLNIVMVWNDGISFGMFQDGSITTVLILSGIALAIVLFFFIWLLNTTSLLQGLALSLVIGGALGNIVDRVRFGAVIDFIDLHIEDWHWPAFNVADASVCIGVVILLLHGLLTERKNS